MTGSVVCKEPLHGDVTFPLRVYKSKSNISNVEECILYCHWHDEVEFFYLTKGSATFYIDTKPIELTAGEAIFVNSGEIHTAYSADFVNCEFYAVVFDLNMLKSNTIGGCQRKYIYPLINKQYLMPRKFTLDSEWGIGILKRIAAIVDDYIDAKPAYEIAITASLYSIISMLIADNQLIPKNPLKSETEDLELFKKSLAYIHSNYKTKLTMLDIAKQIHMSQYHFCRFFKRMAGTTPIEYLICYRVNQAEKCLLETEDKIMDISLEVGFETVSHFIKTFKRIKKYTPSKFRELHYE